MMKRGGNLSRSRSATIGGHRRVPVQSRSTERLLLPRAQPAPAGRAPRDRGHHRRVAARDADPGGDGHPALQRAGGAQVLRPRTRRAIGEFNLDYYKPFDETTRTTSSPRASPRRTPTRASSRRRARSTASPSSRPPRCGATSRSRPTAACTSTPTRSSATSSPRARTREIARKNLVMALKELFIMGEIRTTVEYLGELLETDAFKENTIDTAWLDGIIKEKSVAVEVETDSRPSSTRPSTAPTTRSPSAISASRTRSPRASSRRSRCARCSSRSRSRTRTPSTSFTATPKAPDAMALTIADQTIDVKFREQADGSLYVAYGDESHQIYAKEEPLGLRMVLDGVTVLLPNALRPVGAALGRDGQARALPRRGRRRGQGGRALRRGGGDEDDHLAQGDRERARHRTRSSRAPSSTGRPARLARARRPVQGEEDPHLRRRARRHARGGVDAQGLPLVAQRPREASWTATSSTATAPPRRCSRRSRRSRSSSARSPTPRRCSARSCPRSSTRCCRGVRRRAQSTWRAPTRDSRARRGRPSTSTSSQLEAKREAIRATLAPITAVIEKFAAGLRENAVNVVCAILSRYLTVESAFAEAASTDAAIASLIKANPDGLDDRLKTAFAHEQLSLPLGASISLLRNLVERALRRRAAADLPPALDVRQVALAAAGQRLQGLVALTAAQVRPDEGREALRRGRRRAQGCRRRQRRRLRRPLALGVTRRSSRSTATKRRAGPRCRSPSSAGTAPYTSST